MIQHVFVYGTLRQGQCRENLWPRRPLSVAVAYVRGHLFDLGPYPAMLAGGDPIRGECWALRGEDIEETLRVLDEIEGFGQPHEVDLYERRVVEIFNSPLPGAVAPVSGYAYFLVPERLPAFARRIHPRFHPAPSHPTQPVPTQANRKSADRGETRFYASWPDDGRTVVETSSLPDPFGPVPPCGPVA